MTICIAFVCFFFNYIVLTTKSTTELSGTLLHLKVVCNYKSHIYKYYTFHSSFMHSDIENNPLSEIINCLIPFENTHFQILVPSSRHCLMLLKGLCFFTSYTNLKPNFCPHKFFWCFHFHIRQLVHGVRLITYAAIIMASAQYDLVKSASNRKHFAFSTRVWFIRSAIPFCSGGCGIVVSCLMAFLVR